MKVIGKRKIPNEDVYNMEVDEHHNFAVNGGSIVHNCDALRYWCIMWTRPSKEPEKALPMHDRNVARVIAQKKKKTKQLV